MGWRWGGGTLYLCALRVYWPRSCQCTQWEKLQLRENKKGENVPNWTLCVTESRLDAVVARLQSTSRGGGKPLDTRKVPAVSRRVACAPSESWALLTVGRQGASRWMQRPICLKHTHRAGSDKPSRPSVSLPAWGGGTWFTTLSYHSMLSENRLYTVLWSRVADWKCICITISSWNIYYYTEIKAESFRIIPLWRFYQGFTLYLNKIRINALTETKCSAPGPTVCRSLFVNYGLSVVLWQCNKSSVFFLIIILSSVKQSRK